MRYNTNCHTVRNGALFVSSADVFNNTFYWVKHPVLLDNRPADCVTTSAGNTGCFIMGKRSYTDEQLYQDYIVDGLGPTEIARKYGVTQSTISEILKRLGFPPAKKGPKPKKVGTIVACTGCGNEYSWSKNNFVSVAGKIRQPCKRCNRKRVKKWGKENKERRNTRSRENYTPGQDTERRRRWERNNRDKANAKAHRRRAREKGAEGSYSDSDWRAIVKQQDGRCLACGKKRKLTVDHVIPLDKGGSNNPENLQGLCGRCNSRKGTDTTDYRKEGGILRWVQEKLL